MRGRSSLLFYFIIHFSEFVLSSSVRKTRSISLLGEIVKSLYNVDPSNHTKLISMFQLDNEYLQHVEHIKQCTANRTRFKRQGSQFTSAAKSGQTKMFRLWLQMFKNINAKVPVGPPHPLHVTAPATYIELMVNHVFKYFSPDVNEPPKVDKV